jgi:hypothetical protein
MGEHRAEVPLPQDQQTIGQIRQPARRATTTCAVMVAVTGPSPRRDRICDSIWAVVVARSPQVSISAPHPRAGAEAASDVGGFGGSPQGDRVDRLAHEAACDQIGGDSGRVGVAVWDVGQEAGRIRRKCPRSRGVAAAARRPAAPRRPTRRPPRIPKVGGRDSRTHRHEPRRCPRRPTATASASHLKTPHQHVRHGSTRSCAPNRQPTRSRIPAPEPSARSARTRLLPARRDDPTPPRQHQPRHRR